MWNISISIILIISFSINYVQGDLRTETQAARVFMNDLGCINECASAAMPQNQCINGETGDPPFVKCTNDAIVAINFSGLNLNGFVNEMQLQQLISLKTINLVGNALRNMSLDAFNSLKNLTALSIGGSEQQFTRGPPPRINFPQLNLFSCVSCRLTRYDTLIVDLPADLKTLVLHDNEFAPGPLPTSMAKFSALTSLQFNRNGVTSADVLSKIPSLVDVRMMANQLSDLTPFQELRSLQKLYISFNKFTGPIDKLGDLTQLREFQLSNNEFSGNPFQTLNKMTNLEFLAMQSNNFTGSLVNGESPAFVSLTNLQRFILEKNDWSTSTFPDLTHFKNLTEFICDHCNITDQMELVSDKLSNLNRLTELRLSRNNIRGALPSQTLANNLEIFTMADNELTGGLNDFLASNNKLKVISMSFNPFVDSQFPVLTTVPSLREFHCFSCQLFGSTLSVNNKNLQILNLSRNRLSFSKSELEKLVANAPKLEILRLTENPLSGQMPDLHELSSLSILAVAHTNYTTFPSQLSSFNALQQFIAAGAKLTGDLPLLPYSLKMLNVSFNSLTGSLREIERLRSLVSLDVSHNQVTGSVPAFAMHPELDVLILHDNKLSGTLPDIRAKQSLSICSLTIENGGNCFEGTYCPPNCLCDPLCPTSGKETSFTSTATVISSNPTNPNSGKTTTKTLTLSTTKSLIAITTKTNEFLTITDTNSISTNPIDDTQQSSEPTLSLPLIIVIAIGGLCLILIIIAVIVAVLRSRNNDNSLNSTPLSNATSSRSHEYAAVPPVLNSDNNSNQYTAAPAEIQNTNDYTAPPAEVSNYAVVESSRDQYDAPGDALQF